MNKSEELFNKLNLFQKETRIEYDKAISRLEKDLVFCEDPILDVEEQLDSCSIVDVVNEINGGVYSVYVIKINKSGFIGVDLDDYRDSREYSLEDISNEYNKIELISLIEQHND